MAAKDDEPTELPPLYIREYMKALGVTGEKLAEQMGTTPATVSRLLNGKRQMTVAWLYAFSKALGVSIENLFRRPGAISFKSPETDLRSALLAFGVDGSQLDRALGVIRGGFIKAPEGSPEQTPSDDQSPPASHPHELEPSRSKSVQRTS